MNLYSHKPAQIKTISDLIQFFKGIPDDTWITGARENDNGRCAFGHLGAAYCGNAEDSRVHFMMMSFLDDPDNIILVNDLFCAMSHNPNAEYIPKDIGPKARVLAYLNSLQPEAHPSSEVMGQVVTLAVATAPC
jgi:hypothetical protein